MLIERKANQVVTLKLVSGEEVIGYFKEEDDNSITLRKPVVPVPTQEGSLALAPMIMSSDYLRDGDGAMTFNKATVITTLPTGREFSSFYTKQVSGLDLDVKPGLIKT